jgi:choline/carnitine/betaine transport
MDNQQNVNVPWYKRVDKMIFTISFSVIMLFFLWAIFAGKNMGEVMTVLFKITTNQFGGLYLIIGFALVVFAVWLIFGPYGNVKLGKDDDKPEYSFFSWFAMLFACGYGIGLVFWGAAEPLSFYQSPPLGIEGGTPQAAEIALAYAFFHWGWTPWAMYTAITIPVAYFMFRKGMAPRFSSALQPLIGDHYEGTFGKILDSILIFGTIGGLATSLGLGIKTLASGLNNVFGVETTMFVYLMIALVWVAIFSTSAVTGIDRGIKVLSDINIPLAIILMVFMYLVGDLAFTFNLGVNAFGDYVDKFLKISFWTDPVAGGGFPQGWTIFYWAWWFACAPATGFFIAKISKGRTIRQVVAAHMGLAPVATWLWFTAFGGNALFFETKANMGLVSLMNEKGTESVIFNMLDKLPLSGITSLGFLVLVILFLSTTADSFSYVCAQVTTKKEHDPQNPPKVIRAVWAISIGLAAIILIIFGDGITGLQLSSIVSSFLIMFVMLGMCVALVKALREEKMAANKGKNTIEAAENTNLNA